MPSSLGGLHGALEATVWLNDLSSKPPASETMHALKSGLLCAGAEAEGLSDSVPPGLVVSARSPQPARASVATPTSAAIRAVFFTASS